MAAKYDTKSYCRQTLIGGNYGLLNTTTFEPNPDYYRLISLSRNAGKVFSHTRSYSHSTTELDKIFFAVNNSFCFFSAIMQCSVMASIDGDERPLSEFHRHEQDTGIRALRKRICKQLKNLYKIVPVITKLSHPFIHY